MHHGRKRTHGDEIHDVIELLTKAEAHIARQVSEYDRLPWLHPVADKYLNLEAR
jgi:hypothetical protein